MFTRFLPSIHYLTIMVFSVTLLGLMPSPTSAARFLIPEPPVYGMGHIQSLSAVSAELVERGHHVTLLCATPDCTRKFSRCNANEIIFINTSATLGSVKNFNKLVMGKYDFKGNIVEQFQFMKDLFKVMATICNDMFADNKTLSYLQESSFDMLLVDAFNPCDMLLKEYLHLPFVVLTGNREYTYVNHWNFHLQRPLAYMPVTLSRRTDQMNFFQRVENCFRQWLNLFLVHNLGMDDPFYVIRDKYGISPKDIMTIARGAEVWLSQEDVSLDFPHPGMPNWVPVGGLAVRPAEPLQKVGPSLRSFMGRGRERDQYKMMTLFL